MASYLIVNPPGVTGKDERAVIVRDGFSIFGLCLPLIFLLWHRLWLAGLIFVVLALGASILARSTGIAILPTIFWIVSSLYVGLEGKYLRVATFLARGWKIAAIVTAGSLGEAEAIYFEDEGEDRQNKPAHPPIDWAPADSSQALKASQGPAIGLVNPFGGRG